MTKTLFAGATGALMLLVASPALADGEFYGSLSGGLAFADLRQGSVDVDTDTGLSISGAAGYDIQGPLRFEATGTFAQAGLDEGGLDGDFQMISALGNTYLDIDLPGTVKPHLGVGAGIAQIDVDAGSAFSDDEIVFAWNAIAGVDYSFDGRMTFSAGYRYMGLGDATIGGAEFESKVHLLHAGGRVPF